MCNGVGAARALVHLCKPVPFPARFRGQLFVRRQGRRGGLRHIGEECARRRVGLPRLFGGGEHALLDDRFHDLVEPRERLRAIVDHGEEFGVLIAWQRLHRDRRLLLQLAQQVLGGFDVARNGAGSRDRHGYAAGTRADAPVATVANASRRSETMVMKPSTFATSFRPLSVISSRTR